MSLGQNALYFIHPCLLSSSDHFQNVTSVILLFIAPEGSEENFSLSLKRMSESEAGGAGEESGGGNPEAQAGCS